MQKKQKYIWLATLLNLLLFIIRLNVSYPIYNSKEDAYVLYLLSGGIGKATVFV